MKRSEKYTHAHIPKYGVKRTNITRNRFKRYQLDIATKSLLTFFFIFSIYAQWIGRFSLRFEYCKIVSVIEMKLRRYEWRLYVIIFFWLVSTFSSAYFRFFLAVCAREWPKFHMHWILFIERHQAHFNIYHTVVWCWLFSAFNYTFLFVCLFVLRMVQTSQTKKLNRTIYVFLLKFSASYSPFYELESYAKFVLCTLAHSGPHHVSRIFSTLVLLDYLQWINCIVCIVFECV